MDHHRSTASLALARLKVGCGISKLLFQDPGTRRGCQGNDFLGSFPLAEELRGVPFVSVDLQCRAAVFTFRDVPLVGGFFVCRFAEKHKRKKPITCFRISARQLFEALREIANFFFGDHVQLPVSCLILIVFCKAWTVSLPTWTVVSVNPCFVRKLPNLTLVTATA